MNLHSVIFLTVFSFSILICRAENEVFWEAEDAIDTSMKVNGPYRPLTGEETEKVSGGSWLNGSVGEEPLFAEYDLKVPTAGTYQFYARKYWQHGAFRWSVDGGEWHEVRKSELLDSVSMREFVPMNWVFLDEIELSAGDHKIRIEVQNDASYEFSKAYGFDCFLLTSGSLGDYLQVHPGIGGELK